MREHPDELIRQFDWTLSSRAEFARLCAANPDTLTDIQRAARFAWLQTLSFAGKPADATQVTPGQMGPSARHPAKMTLARMRRLIEAAHRRLRGVHVECLNWDAFLRRYDRPLTLFYLDPPYWGHKADYGKAAAAGCLPTTLRRGTPSTTNPRLPRRSRFAGQPGG